MILRLICATLALALSAPAVPQTHITIPVDSVARAKFRHDDPALVDKLAFINAFVNAAIEPMSDSDHYGLLDYWVSLPPDAKGDCEDYAASKFVLIEGLDGQPINPIAQMKLVGVMLDRGRGGHAILAIRLPSGAVMYLDNLQGEPMTRKELKARGYLFFDWRA